MAVVKLTKSRILDPLDSSAITDPVVMSNKAMAKDPPVTDLSNISRFSIHDKPKKKTDENTISPAIEEILTNMEKVSKRPEGEIPHAGMSGPRSGHKLSAFILCPRYHALRYSNTIDKKGTVYGPILPRVERKALARGSVFHVALALLYNRMKCWQEGTNIAEWAKPLEYLNWYIDQAGGALAAGKDGILETFGVYMKTAEKDAKEVRVVGVEKCYEVVVGNSFPHTRSVDLVIELNGKIFFVDHKTLSRMNVKVLRRYSMDSQRLDYEWMGAKIFGDKFGGVIYNGIIFPNTYRGRRQDPYVHRFSPEDAPLAISEREDQVLIAYKERHKLWHKPISSWPAIASEKNCGDSIYGACNAYNFCRLGGTGVERMSLPVVPEEGEP